jgi:hypothetical protein
LHQRFFPLTRSQCKQFHLGRNMAFTAGLGPAMRAAAWGWKSKSSREVLVSLLRIMLLHDVHRDLRKLRSTTDHKVLRTPYVVDRH